MIPKSSESRLDLGPVWIGMLAVLAHGLALKAAFTFDDFHHLHFEEVFEDSGAPLPALRVLPYLLWKWVHAVAGFSSAGFHLLNLGVHVLVSLAFLGVARRWTSRAGWFEDGDPRVGTVALVAAALFAVHPLGSEPVNYARCLMIQLATLFTLAAAGCTLEAIAARGRAAAGWGLAAAVSVVAATYSKQTGLFHASLTVGVVLAVFASDLPRRAWTGIREARRVHQGLLAVVLAVAAIVLHDEARYWLQKAWVTVTAPEYTRHLLTQSRVFWLYLSKVGVPVGLSSDHLIARSTGWEDTAALVSFVALAGLVGAIAWLLGRPRQRAVAGLGAIGCGHLLLRFLHDNGEHMVEYRVYPSLPWFMLLAAVGLGLLLDPKARHARAVRLGAAAIVLLFAAASARRSTVWHDSSRVAGDVLQRYPLNNRARSTLMLGAYQAGDYALVERLFAMAATADAAAGRFNRDEGPRRGRRLDPDRILEDRAVCESIRIMGLAETHGVPKAIAYADAVLGALEERKRTDGHAETDGLYVESLIVRNRGLLAKVGADYEARREAERRTAGNAPPEP